MSRPHTFAHVVYRTRNFDRMLDWYQRVFEAKVQFQSPVLAFLTYDDEHHRFALVNLALLAPTAPPLNPPATATVEHVAYGFKTLHDLMTHYVRLKEQGITPYWAIHHGITISLYYGDPDGNQMEFQTDCFANNDEANAYMYGPDFAQNPIGVEFDPEPMAAAVLKGAPLSDFARRPPGPMSPVRSAARQL